MTEHSEPFHLRLDDNFSGRMRLAADAARTLGARMALQQATWEPHDWAEWP